MRSIPLVLSLLLILPGNSIAASFDCSKATTKAEKMVCANPELSRLDESLSRAYRAVQKRFGKAAVRDQRWWLLLRDGCSDESCLKLSYKLRIEELESPEYAAKPRRGTGAGKNAPSYFSETPIRSIDEMIEGCFADKQCASYAEPLIPRYSKESNIDEDTLRETLKHCLAYEQSMYICSGFMLFVLENEFADVLSDAIEPAGERCEIAMEKRQYSWGNKIGSICERKAFEESGGGTMYTGVVISCVEDRYRERIEALRSLGTCEPCSMCLNLP